MSDEQRVRTMAGWIGVEISRSRVRTPGKAGYGLYRVRGSAGRAETPGRIHHRVRQAKHGEWTAYAFTLEEIEVEIWPVIRKGDPSGPLPLVLMPSGSTRTEDAVTVPTRWTSAYRGRRDLGVRMTAGEAEDVEVAVRIKPEYAAELTALAALVDEGLVRMSHDPVMCVCSGTAKLTAACVRLTMRGSAESSTVRSRQREANAAFQAEHRPRRDAGLRARHAAKLARQGNERQAPEGR